MSNRIYRAKAIKTCPFFKKGDWVKGFYLEAFTHNKFRSFIRFSAMEIEVDKDTVGQCAGLKDKNEIEIYEGDIVRCCDAIGVIQFDCGTFGINWDYGKEYKTMLGCWGQRHNLRKIDDEIIDELEVIGNIYDNPELIK